MDIGADGKYDQILNPLREMEKVWGINLAGVLQDYVSEVAAVTVEMGARVLNFAQAAMLIMGASTIYSRKVDLLQELAQEVYELIINKGKLPDDKDNSKVRRRRVVVRDIVPFTEEATVHTLLPAEKLVRTDHHDTLRNIMEGRASETVSAHSATNRIAEGELVPFEDTATGTVNYRTSVCVLTQAGLLLPNVRYEIAEGCHALEQLNALQRQTSGLRVPPTPGPESLTARRLALMSRATSCRRADGIESEACFAKALEKELVKATEEDEDEKEAEEEKKKEAAEEDEENGPKPPPRLTAHSRMTNGPNANAMNEDEEGDEESDDEIEEDEFEAIMTEHVGDRFSDSMPNCTPPRVQPWAPYVIRLRKAAADPSKLAEAELKVDRDWTTTALKVRHLDDQGEVVWDNERFARLAPSNQDLTELITGAKKRIRKEAGQARKQNKQERWLEAQRKSEGSMPDDGGLAAFVELNAEDDDSSGIGGDDAAMDMGAPDLGPLNTPAPRTSNGPWAMGSCGAEAKMPRYSAAGQSFGTYSDNTAESETMLSFFKYLARYDELLYTRNLADSEKLANLSREESDLHNRIAAWTAKIGPQIDEQLGRTHFDIYAYAQRILDSFSQTTQKLSFADIAGKCAAPWEVPRYYLAMLQLTNNGNLKLEVDRKLDGALCDDINVVLLSREAAFAFDVEDANAAFARGNALAAQNETTSLPSPVQVTQETAASPPKSKRRRK
eukprot:Hpha_TRINITY_DN15055_c5_g2::TRINITY_DN15055_c5_g2_i1::g.126256::m.126256